MMKYEEAKELVEKTDTDFKIKNRKLLGIEILNKYVDEVSFSAEHDQIYLNDCKDIIEKMTKEDIEFMAKCGFMIDEEFDCWSFFA